jgi:pimeloyl-ACP methyl ester carboxylesterase
VISAANDRPRVLIAHGWIGRSGQMRPLARHLAAAGFETTILAYPTAVAPFSRAVEIALLAAGAGGSSALHLIGYSLGGLVMRALAAEKPPGLASLLLIGTPNAGSRLADFACKIAPTPALRRLSTSAPELPVVSGIPVGCIAGSRSGPLGFLFGAQSDGRVAVGSALGVQHNDARVLPVSHRGLPFSRETARLAVSFLTTGHFGETNTQPD